MKTYSLEEVTDELIGKKGTPERDMFDRQLESKLLRKDKSSDERENVSDDSNENNSQ